MLYFVVGLLWGMFSALMQGKVQPSASKDKLWAAFWLNAIGWPIGMTVAIIMLATGKHDKFFKVEADHE